MRAPLKAQVPRRLCGTRPGTLLRTQIPISAKLVEKHREGSKWVRRHDRPQTAYQRLVAGGQLENKEARRLRDWHQTLDPFELARQTEQRLKPILG